MLSVKEAIQHMLKSVHPVTESETLSIDAGVDRILAQDVLSTVDIPAYDNSAMDGFALHLTEPNQTGFTVVGQALAGHPFQGQLVPGQAIRIMTGAQVPQGANAVVPIENTEQDKEGEQVRLFNPAQLHAHIRKRGEELVCGATVFSTGHQLTPVDIGLLASLGVAKIDVFKRLQVALFSTGDELVLPGQTRRPDQIYDSNRFVLHAMLERAGFSVLNLGLIPDNKQEIADAFMQASTQADAIICSGGVSVGDADYTKQVIDAHGDVGFWKVAMKPGKPFAFGKVNGSWFFGLPGNPVSATITLQQLALPALYQLAGRRSVEPLEIVVTAGETLKKRPGRADFQRGILRTENGITQVFSAGNQGSGMLSSVAKANCLILLDAEQGTLERGELVRVQVLEKPFR
ncbi:molybdopterin molybdotransferase MoeA [Aliidiomarina indica]|uniref:molybdopterin molybdotransferase MoeA n=1 Tax=Aliidiomarina indica TaxID=2749147 RepID=UPI001890B4CC|nr:gephyrin-like molybdotransferase Glp [Aliidiomarina indica]